MEEMMRFLNLKQSCRIVLRLSCLVWLVLQSACTESSLIDVERTLPAESTLVKDSWENLQPSWLPSDEAIVYTARPRAEVPDHLPRDRGLLIRKYTLNSRTISDLVIDSSGVAYPAVSPDGQVLAFCRDQEIRCLDLTSGVSMQMTDEQGREELPRWSPDGKTLAYLASGKLYLRPAGGGPATAISAPDSLRAFCWLPDGSGWLYSARHNGTLALFCLPGDGNGVRRVPSDNLIGDWPVAGAPPPAVRAVIGIQMLFHFGTALVLTPLEQEEMTWIALKGRTPAWSADGSRIVYSRDGELVANTVFVVLDE